MFKGWQYGVRNCASHLDLPAFSHSYTLDSESSSSGLLNLLWISDLQISPVVPDPVLFPFLWNKKTTVIVQFVLFLR